MSAVLKVLLFLLLVIIGLVAYGNRAKLLKKP